MEGLEAVLRVKLKNQCDWSCFLNPLTILNAHLGISGISEISMTTVFGPTTLRDSGSRPSGMRHRKTLINNKKNKKKKTHTKNENSGRSWVLKSWPLSLWASCLLTSLSLSHLFASSREHGRSFRGSGGAQAKKKSFIQTFWGGFVRSFAPPPTFPRSSPNCKTTWQIDC